MTVSDVLWIAAGVGAWGVFLVAGWDYLKDRREREAKAREAQHRDAPFRIAPSPLRRVK